MVKNLEVDTCQQNEVDTVAIVLKNVVVAPGTEVVGSSPSLEEKSVDIGIDADGQVTAIGPDVALDGAQQIDCQGAWVSPGWIDLHTHVYVGGTDFSVEPEAVGPVTGVLALADAGSAGEANFSGFARFVAEPAEFPVVAYLNIGSIGLTAANRVSEVAYPESIDLARTIDCARQYPQLIKAIKVRLCGEVAKEAGTAPLDAAVEAAEALGLPVVVHIGRSRPNLTEILPKLRSGDMVTHIFHGKVDNTFLECFDAVMAARQRGVLFDVGHGAASFSYKMAEAAVQAGFLPDAISTDLHGWSIDGPVWNLGTTMAKMLAVGMPLVKVLTAVTKTAADFLGEPEWGRITVGQKARLTVFELIDGGELPDSLGQKRQVAQVFQPKFAVQGTRMWTC